MAESVKKGKFIGLAGIDGSGKSTQAELLTGYLNQRGSDTILQEGDRVVASHVSTLLAKRHGQNTGMEYLGEDSYLLCHAFDVLQEITNDVMPYVYQGTNVVVPRTPYCRLAGGLRRGANTVEKAKEVMLFNGEPDLIIWLDIEPELAQLRIMSRSLEMTSLTRLANYRRAFEIVLTGVKHTRIDCGEMNVAEVQSKIVEVVDSYLLNN